MEGEIVRRRLEIVAHRDRERGPRTDHTVSPTLAYTEWQTFAGRRHVRLLVPAPDGSVWIASWGGVLHWWPEQERCVHYGSEHGLPGNATAALAADETGTIWAAGERRGLASLQAGGTIWENIPAFSATRITMLAPRPGGGVYTALQEKRVHRNAAEVDHSLGVIYPDGYFRLLLKNTLACQHVKALSVDVNGDLWIGNPWGLHRYRAKEGEVDSIDAANGSGVVTAISSTGSGSMWLGTQNGLYHCRTDPEPSFSRDEDWPRGTVLALALDLANHILWLATPGQVGRIYDNVWQPITELSPGRVESLLVVPGSEESVWSGGAEGVCRITAGELQPDLSPAPTDAMGAAVTAVALVEEAEGKDMWFGSGQGVHYYQPLPETEENTWGSWKHFVDEPLLQDVRVLLPAAGGGVWAGSWQGGMQEVQPVAHVPSPWNSGPVVTIQPGAGRNANLAATLSAVYEHTPDGKQQQLTVSPPETQVVGAIHAIMGEEQGLFIGSSRGLFRFSQPTGLWTPVEGLEEEPVQALVRDGQGRLWVGTPNGLVYETDAGWVREPLGDILTLAIVPGALWIGTRGGIQRCSLPQPGASLAGETRQTFTMTNSGLAADFVTGLYWHPRGEGYDLWACGPAGASRYYVTADAAD